MITTLNSKQKKWIVKALDLYGRLVKPEPNKMARFAVVLSDGIEHRLDTILMKGTYDNDTFSYDMRCINLLKAFYRHHGAMNTYIPENNSYIAGADVATDDSDFSAITIFSKKDFINR